MGTRKEESEMQALVTSAKTLGQVWILINRKHLLDAYLLKHTAQRDVPFYGFVQQPAMMLRPINSVTELCGNGVTILQSNDISPMESSSTAATTPTDDSKQNLTLVTNSIEKTLGILHQLDLTVSSNNVASKLPLLRAMNNLVLELDNMKKLADNCNIQVPMEVINLIDDGKNPDEFTRDVLNSCVAKNQITKGKTDTFKSFRSHLLKELDQTFPDEVEAYREILAASAAEKKKIITKKYERSLFESSELVAVGVVPVRRIFSFVKLQIPALTLSSNISSDPFLFVSGILGKLKEYIDDTEDFINIQLDNVGNQLIQFELLLTTATFVVAIFGVVAGIFGMNFAIPMFDYPGAFKWVLMITGVIVGCT
ncbi:unnamed protein product [Fraxinus pennsylvanica]|uniref:Mediator of RNA polymerase II transcription subunit 10 n=1 Tax=Fraxinus pennsylvanica TaxID=56036 RepID=A0AAD2DUU9_9LAMI|nr:unnamed protein product [Fraxinus pennsylvanica]